MTKRTVINLSNLDPNTITKLIRMLVKELAKAQQHNQELQAKAQTIGAMAAWAPRVSEAQRNARQPQMEKAAATEVATASKAKKTN